MSRKKGQIAALLSSPDEVEAAFYDALREGDLDKLMAVWAEDEEVVCVHPGGHRLIGLQAVRAGFEAVFASGGVGVQLDSVRRLGSLSCAVHSLTERVLVQTDEGPRTGWVMATNVYFKTALGWRLVAHHASPGFAEQPVELSEAPAVWH
jgi:uncharacterized protein (TIGR02246 family)